MPFQKYQNAADFVKILFITLTLHVLLRLPKCAAKPATDMYDDGVVSIIIISF